MKLWEKGIATDKLIETFTIGKDKDLDVFLAEYDVIGTLAHIRMLQSINLLTSDELDILSKELKSIYNEIQNNNFRLEDGVEDVHSQVELMLTRKLGDTGKKVHSGRSRNDQVLVDLKLFIREELIKLVEKTLNLFQVFIQQSNRYKEILMPGYTHLQIAMPSSFGLWFGAYAESLTDDMQLLLSAYRINNQNPLGSAAGYGSSFPLNRQMTTRLLGFDRLNYNSIYAQAGRGKNERTVSFAIASLAATLSKFATDVCLFINQNFGFIAFPDELTTGSSIMPHKKNPDVFELIRAKGNKLQALPNEIAMITANLPTGYHRDLQVIKEIFMPAFDEIQNCLDITAFMLRQIIVNTDILQDEKYKFLFSVEEVNRLVLNGVPFRDAYKNIAQSIANNEFTPEKKVTHTHEGSISNLMNAEIEAKMQDIVSQFDIKNVKKAIEKLLAIDTENE